MKERIEAQLKKLDVNGDGKINLADAREVLDRELAQQRPSIVSFASFIAGLVIGFVAGRASK